MAGKADIDWHNRREGQAERIDSDSCGDGAGPESHQLRACRIARDDLDDPPSPLHWQQVSPEPDPGALVSLAADPAAAPECGQRHDSPLLPSFLASRNSPLWVALTASGVLHAVLLAILLVNRGNEFPLAVTVPESIRINLLPPPPQVQPDPPVEQPIALQPPGSTRVSPPAQPIAQPASGPIPDAASPSAPPAEAIAVNPLLDENLNNLVERAEPSRDAARDQTPAQRPTVAAIVSQLGEIQETDRAQAWRRECSRRQQQSEVLDCPQVDARDYSAAPGEAIYRALNPVRAVSRSERSLPAVAANVTGLAQRLADSAVPAELAGYLLEQTEVSITDGSTSGNRAVQHMRRMTDKSAAAEQARMLLSDPWVINRSRELQQRKVVER